MTWRTAKKDYATRFSGSMSWKTIAGKRYLYRKTDKAAKSLGPETADTQEIYARFIAGRASLKSRIDSLDTQIRAQAKIAKAMDLGRVPLTTARVLRSLDKIGSLGQGISVAGTNALYVYERMAGVHFSGDLAATMDVDWLYDARGGLDLLSSRLAETGLIGLLHTIDPSFALTARGSFRAANDKGFMVDLITPGLRNPAVRRFRQTLGDSPDDLSAVEIEGLTWLENSPSVEHVVVDERGFPLMMVVPDPRAFICHKLWVADRADREPIKRYRDKRQARAVCEILILYLTDLRFDDPILGALPAALRDRGCRLAEEIKARRASDGMEDWE